MYRYRKAGVVLSEIRPAGTEQAALFDEDGAAMPEADPAREAVRRRLMAAVDGLNGRFGKRAVVFASMGPPSVLRRTRDGTAGAPRWEMRREHMTPRYTTRWAEVAVARA